MTADFKALHDSLECGINRDDMEVVFLTKAEAKALIAALELAQ